MATNFPKNVSFDKMTQFDNAAAEIHQTFDPLIEQLIAKRDYLLQRVHELREDYWKKEGTRTAAIKELERVHQYMQEMSIKVNTNLEFHRQFSQSYKHGMKKQEPPVTFLCPIFRCQNKDTIQQLISELGEIVPCEIPDYSLKKEPVLTAGKLGGGANELFARGIAFDDSTELICIADSSSSRVQIMSLKGEFLTQLKNDKLSHPWGVAITNECIFVTDTDSNSLFQFRKRDFKLINKIGSKIQFDNPRGLCIDTNGDVLVADSLNNRVTIFCSLLNLKSYIGIGQLHYPQDVKLSADRIVVLDWSPNCVHFFSREGHLLSSCISQGDTPSSSVYNPLFFCFDTAGKIILSDSENHVIKVFTENGEHIHTLGKEGEGRGEFVYPYGVCISKSGMLFVVSQNPNYSLQCF